MNTRLIQAKNEHNNLLVYNTKSQINGVDIHVWNALKNSIYSGAKDESIMMVLDYCKAAELDPMQKPVHIVPMWDKNLKCMKDTIMAGIGLYRIQAARSNQYAGVSEPEYGKTINSKLDGIAISHPEWCKVTVKKIVQGVLVEFAAKEYWVENYATAKKDTTAPNTMWKKRPFAQLAKCAEAQALRKAFPELVSHHPTAEEMEGKSFIENDLTPDVTPKTQKLKSRLNDLLASEKSDTQIEDTLATNETITHEEEEQEQQPELSSLILKHNVPLELINKWCEKAGADNVDDLENKFDEAQLLSCKNYIIQHYSQCDQAE
jgi:phage recombination protein Bet